MAASSHLDEEIERIECEMRVLDEEMSAISQRTTRARHDPVPSPSSCQSPPRLKPFDIGSARSQPPPPPPLAPKRKEIEARRYNGKEPVAEYLTQYELTARRNGWTDAEKAVNLLCALEGPARSLLSELDVDKAKYATVKTHLLKRFGPVCLPEVYEQALQDVRLGRGQPIRELTPEVSRLTKLAYLNSKTLPGKGLQLRP